MQIGSVTQSKEDFGIARTADTCRNVRVSEAVGKVVDPKSIIERDTCDAIEDAGEVTQVELLSVP